MTLVLSRYACVRREGERLLAESGVTGERVILDEEGRGVALLGALTRPVALEQAAAAAGLTADDALAVAEPLIAAGVIVDAATAGREDASPWWFHDRLLHTVSRSGQPLEPPTRPAASELPAPRWSETIALAVPDLGAIEHSDPPLAAVQAARRSVREHGPEPLALRRIEELLYRVGRVEDLWHPDPATTFATRPYPSAGALYELELFLVAGDCDGLQPGLYHYMADHHRLACAAGPTGDVRELLVSAAAGMGTGRPPQALIVIAARFDRLAWKYGRIAYSLVLKDVGVVMQTLYLTTTAMGIAGCAVGAGDASLFARAARLGPDDEVSVGEFAIGTMPAT